MKKSKEERKQGKVEQEQGKIATKVATKDMIEAVAIKLAEDNVVTYEYEVFLHFKERGFSVTIANFRPVLDYLCRKNQLVGIRTGTGQTSKTLYATKKAGLVGIDAPYISIAELVEMAMQKFPVTENNIDSDKIVLSGNELKNINAEMFKETLVKHHLEDKSMKDAFLETVSGAELSRSHSHKNESDEDGEDEKINVNLEGFTNEELRYISEHQLLGNGTDPNEFINNIVKSAVQNAATGKLEIESSGRISVTELANMAGNLLGMIQRR